MQTLEQKLKSPNFWLTIGTYNHLVALLVIIFGCVVTGFSCSGEPMQQVLSIYTFTIFTPQLALEAILIIAIFLLTNSMDEFKANSRPGLAFMGTLGLIFIYVVFQ